MEVEKKDNTGEVTKIESALGVVRTRFTAVDVNDILRFVVLCEISEAQWWCLT